MNIDWSDDAILLEGAGAALPQIRRVDEGRMRWVVIRWAGPDRRRDELVFAFSREEFFDRLHATPVPYSPTTRATLAEVLGLAQLAASVSITQGDRPHELPAPGSAAGPAFAMPGVRSAWRAVDLRHGQVAVGGPDVGLHAAMRPGSRSRPPAAPSTPTPTMPTPAAPVPRAAPVKRGAAPVKRSAPPSPPRQDLPRSAPPEAMSGAAPPDGAAAVDDEGTTPVRYPSIEPVGAVRAGAPITLQVDLQREESAHTVGGAMFPDQPADWSGFDVDVVLQSPDVDFDAGGRATVRVRRNANSIAATVSGQVHAGLAAGHALEVKARFMMGTRFCGSAARRLVVQGDAAAPAPAAVTDDAPPAEVQVDANAQAPDLTVYIAMFEQDRPGRLHWRMAVEPFATCPAKLDGLVDLGQKPEAEASQLFKQFAKLERGAHREAIEGFGEALWDKSPAEFKAVYWALCDHLKRPLTIQFVSDDPHLPWELMSPYRDGEQHGPIALRHAVARWIARYAGYMRNRLPTGRLLAVAPHYKSASAQLSLAEEAAQALQDKLGAERVAGTRAELLALLEQPSPQKVALLYFTGHGAFTTEAAGASLIKLEDGAELSALEVGRQKVRLGERDGTVVFLNACEVGATGSVLGSVGGWAGAFLGRRFGAFIAPLWAIDEEDASQVTAELMDAIVRQHQPLGAALRDLRAKHGGVSPTFYSYLLYGDVTARLGTA